MAALRTGQAPLLIRLPNGQLVPASGGALVDTPTPAPAAAMMDDTGALSQHGIRAAGDTGAVAPAAALAQVIDLAQRRGNGGGAAAAPGVPIPRQPDVMTDEQDNSGADLMNLVKAIGAAAGKTGSGAGVHETKIDAPKIDPTDSAFKVPSLPEGAIPNSTPLISSQTAAAPGASAANEPGFLDRMKGFLGIGEKLDNLNPAASLPTPNLQAGNAATYTDRHPGLQVDPGTGQVTAAAAPAGALPQNAAPAKPSGGGFFDQLIDHGDPLTRDPGQAETMAARYGDNYKAPTWFDRLNDNPLRMALIQGGLATMAAGGRRGATPLGALGEGALTGMKGAFEEKASQEQEALKARREDSEAKLREAQGVFYGDRGQVLHEKADTEAKLEPAKAAHLGALTDATGKRADAAGVNANANMIRAGAAVKNADANMVRARKAAAGTSNPTSLMKNSEWLVKSGVAKDAAEAVGILKSAAKNKGQRASLVTARAKLYLQSSIAPTEADVANAKKQAERDVDSDLRDAAPAKGGALGGGDGDNGGALADARYALAHGAPRDKVIAKAKAQGLDTSGL